MVADVFIGADMKENSDRIDRAREIFRQHGGLLRTGEALKLGVHPEVLYRMRDRGVLERMTRGLYRLAAERELGSPDLVAAAKRAPHGVICMISALSFHNMTTQIPHTVDIALVRGARRPQLDHPPVQIYWSVQRIFECGIGKHTIDGQKVRIYTPERTLVDCFRLRNKIGIDVGTEAVRLYRERRRVNVDEIMRCARVCRVEKVIRPYLESAF